MTYAKLAVDAVLTSPPAWAAPAAREIEAAGYDGLVVPEAAHDVFVTMAAAAGATRRVTIGSSIAIAFARTPMAMAYSGHGLQELTGGRFTLGLGPQIRPHIENRYGMPFSQPAARMREYVEALRAIWHTWTTGDRLDFRGDFYQHTLMTPMFAPGPFSSGAPPIHLAAVGPLMTEVAGTVADGLIAHPMSTPAQLADVTRPRLDVAAQSAGRSQTVGITAWCMVGCGDTEASLAESHELVRAQIAFYGSTPAYRPLLAHHGDDGIQPELRRLTKEGAWDRLPALVDDALVTRYAVVGSPDDVGDELVARYRGVADRVCLAFMSADPSRVAPQVIDRMRSNLAHTRS